MKSWLEVFIPGVASDSNKRVALILDFWWPQKFRNRAKRANYFATTRGNKRVPAARR